MKPSWSIPNHCHSYAMNVKTGTDDKASSVPLLAIRTGIHDILNIPIPSTVPVTGWTRKRIAPFELTTWSVEGTYSGYTNEADGDIKFHLTGIHGRVLRCEIPALECVGPTSPWKSRIAESRYRIIQCQKGTVIRVVGVGFWDGYHVATGQDPHELHPVLSVQ